MLRAFLERDTSPTASWLRDQAASLSLEPAVSLAVDDGRITRIYAIRNPHKLAGLDGIAWLTRS